MARRLLTALVVALMISATFTFWISKKFTRPAQAAAAPTLKYVVPAHSLDAGTTLHATDLKTVDWPAQSPLDGAFSKIDALVGRILLYPAVSGQPLNEHDLTAAGVAAGLTTHIPDGMRAISLRSDEVAGVAGFTLPGTHVDVLVSFRNNMTGTTMTSTVLQDVEVLTAGQKMEPDPEGKASPADVVTLLVTPQDAERVVMASTEGTVHFVLRNGADHVRMPDDMAFGNAAPAAKSVPHMSKAFAGPSAGPKPYSVATVNGNKSSSETF